MKSITEAGDLSGKRVLVRVDWNVPIENGAVVDDYRIKVSMPTLEYLRKAGAWVTLMTHLDDETASVEPLRSYVPAGMELLENLRQNPGEKADDPEFAKELAARGDIFVNEAFSVSHRSHASIVGVPKLLPSYAGLEFVKEVEGLSKAFNPPHPFLFILGGAKFETKLPLVRKFQTIADTIFIAGANAKQAFDQGFGNDPKIMFPTGDITALDFNLEAMSACVEAIKSAAFILWNGPVGKYEAGYTEGTKALAQTLAESGKEVIVGGADTLAAIKELDIHDKFAFVSAAGGAMLDFLSTGTLPGIEALN